MKVEEKMMKKTIRQEPNSSQGESETNKEKKVRNEKGLKILSKEVKELVGQL